MPHFLFFSLLVLANRAGAQPEKLRQLNQQWINAIVTRDTASLGSILDKDFIMVNSRGMKTDRRDNLSGLLSNDVSFTAVKKAP